MARGQSGQADIYIQDGWVHGSRITERLNRESIHIVSICERFYVVSPKIINTIS